jgi:MSHA biogenesis protein MshN
MSIINRVLNDIEQRNKTQSNNNDRSFDAVDIKELNNTKWLTSLLIIAVLTLAIAMAWLYISGDFSLSKVESLPVQTIQTTAPIMSVGINHTETRMTPAEKIIPSETEISAKSQKKSIEKITKNIPTFVSIDEDQPLQMTSLPEKIESQMVQQPPANVIAVKEVVTNVISVNKPVDKKVAVKVKQSLKITPIKMSNNELAQLKLSQGLKAQKDGQITKAQEAWRDALSVEPTLHEARIQLAASYYGADETTRAITLLIKGTKTFPSFDGYSLLAAQIYYQLEKPQQALAMLDSPYLKDNTAIDNIVLAGSIAQQLKQWPVAMNNFQALVNRQRDNPQWLLGLAIAQDAQNMSSQAFNNYSYLLTLNSVDKAVLQYAQQRAQALGESLAQRGTDG